MYHFKRSFFYLPVAGLLLITFSGCSLLGIHVNVHNPARAKKPPKFSEARILLGELNRFKECYDVHFYELDIQIDPGDRTLSGSATTKAVATADFDTLQIDLYPNMKINSISSVEDGRSLSYYRKAGAVFVIMPERVRKEEKFGIRIDYIGEPKEAKRPPWRGGFVWKKDKMNYPWIGVACESEGASLWFPCKDHSSDEADSVLMHYTVPANLMAVGNGRQVGESASADSSLKTYSWKVVNPINTYNITVYAGKLVPVMDTMQGAKGQIDLHHYVLIYNEERARKHFQGVKPMIRYFEQAFGPYPWYEDGFGLVEAPYAGMEHQSAIAYGSGFRNIRLLNLDLIMLHETAHEWWGNSVTAVDFADMWLQEGVASYAEAMYVEDKDGKKDYTSYMFLQRLFIKNKKPLVWIRGRRYFDYRDSDVYLKGSWMLHTLRHVMEDDSLFFDILRTFRIHYHAQLVTSADFVKWVNDKSGKDYNWFFDHYLYHRKAPILEYYIDRKAEDPVIYYRWKNAEEEFKMPCTFNYSTEKEGYVRLDLIPGEDIKKASLKGILTNNEGSFDVLDKYYGTEETKKLVRLARKAGK